MIGETTGADACGETAFAQLRFAQLFPEDRICVPVGKSAVSFPAGVTIRRGDTLTHYRFLQPLASEGITARLGELATLEYRQIDVDTGWTGTTSLALQAEAGRHALVFPVSFSCTDARGGEIRAGEARYILHVEAGTECAARAEGSGLYRCLLRVGESAQLPRELGAEFRIPEAAGKPTISVDAEGSVTARAEGTASVELWREGALRTVYPFTVVSPAVPVRDVFLVTGESRQIALPENSALVLDREACAVLTAEDTVRGVAPGVCAYAVVEACAQRVVVPWVLRWAGNLFVE